MWEKKERSCRIRSATQPGQSARIVAPTPWGGHNFHNFTPRRSLWLKPIHQFPPSARAASSSRVLQLHRAIGKAIDIGNTCDVDFADVLEYYASDSETKIIVLHIEGIQDGRKFLQAVRKVTLHKVVLALKTGRTEMGGQKAASHSGSMAGRISFTMRLFNSVGSSGHVIRRSCPTCEGIFHASPA